MEHVPLMLDTLPSDDDLYKMAENQEIASFYHQLRDNYPIDYDQLALTAKSLKTISD